MQSTLPVTEKSTAAPFRIEPITYPVIASQIEKMAAAYLPLVINGIEDKEGQKTVTAARLKVKATRVAVEKRRKELKASSLEYGRKVDEAAKDIFAMLEPIETHLIAEEQKVADELARIEREKAEVHRAKIQSRVHSLTSVGVILPWVQIEAMTDAQYADAVNEGRERQRRQAALQMRLQSLRNVNFFPPAEKVEALSDDEFAAELQRATEAHEAAKARAAQEEAERKAEAERLAKEREELEAQRAAERAAAEKARQEQEAKLAAERAELDRQRAEMQAEQDRLAAERRQIEETARKAREEFRRARIDKLRELEFPMSAITEDLLGLLPDDWEAYYAAAFEAFKERKAAEQKAAKEAEEREAAEQAANQAEPEPATERVLDWCDEAAREIVDNYEDWDSEGMQIAQSSQSIDAGISFVRDRVAGAIRGHLTQVNAQLLAACKFTDSFPELNMRNYTDDDVARLQDWALEFCAAADAAIAAAESEASHD